MLDLKRTTRLDRPLTTTQKWFAECLAHNSLIVNRRQPRKNLSNGEKALRESAVDLLFILRVLLTFNFEMANSAVGFS